jgi:predicted nucleic acid-binding protein
LDASAAVRIVTGQDEGGRLAAALDPNEPTRVPDLFAAEVTSALWKLARFGGVDAEVAGRSLQAALALPSEVATTRELAAEVFAAAIRHDRPVYDLFYFVLARRHDAVLVTADRRLGAFAVAQGVRVVGVTGW